MKRPLTSLAVVCLLALNLLALVNPTNALTATTLGTTSSAGTLVTMNRAVCYSTGYYYVFYTDATNFVYQSSADGSTWSTKTAVRADPNSGTLGNQFFNVWCDATTGIYYAYSTSSDNKVNYRYGTVSGGIISWSVAEQQEAIGSVSYVTSVFSLAASSSSSMWVSVAYMNATTIQTNTAVGKLGGAWAYKYRISATVQQPSQVVVDSTGTNVATLFGVYVSGTTACSTITDSKHKVASSTNGGTTWTTTTQTAANYNSCMASMIMKGSTTIEIAMMQKSGTYPVYHWNCVMGAGSCSAAVQVAASTSQPSSYGPSLSTDGTNLFLFTGIPSSTTQIGESVSADGGATWSAVAAIVTGEATIVTKTFQSAPQAEGVAWTAGTNPYNVRFVSAAATTSANVVAPCTFFQLQCWWYPLLFMGLYSGILLLVASMLRTSSRGKAHIFLSAVTYGSLIAVILGVMNIVFPLIMLIVNTIIVLRLRG